MNETMKKLRAEMEAKLAFAKAAEGAEAKTAIMAEYDEAHRMRVASDGPRDLKWTPGLKMPWPKVTEFMNGLRAGLHVIAARPSVGKTAFAVNLMVQSLLHCR